MSGLFRKSLGERLGHHRFSLAGPFTLDVTGSRLGDFVEHPDGPVTYRLHFERPIEKGERVRFSSVEERRDDLPIRDSVTRHDWERLATLDS